MKMAIFECEKVTRLMINDDDTSGDEFDHNGEARGTCGDEVDGA